jgi:hypothetical protein
VPALLQEHGTYRSHIGVTVGHCVLLQKIRPLASCERFPDVGFLFFGMQISQLLWRVMMGAWAGKIGLERSRALLKMQCQRIKRRRYCLVPTLNTSELFGQTNNNMDRVKGATTLQNDFIGVIFLAYRFLRKRSGLGMPISHEPFFDGGQHFKMAGLAKSLCMRIKSSATKARLWKFSRWW